MKVYHVCSISKFKRYRERGIILPPVRAWKDIESAERFSCQTGRQIILRLKFKDSDVKELLGHKGNAVCLDRLFVLPKELLS